MTSECDCCGKQGEISGPLIVCGIETYACEKCRGVEEENEQFEREHNAKEFPTS